MTSIAMIERRTRRSAKLMKRRKRTPMSWTWNSVSMQHHRAAMEKYALLSQL